jgi:hypothetical protein
MVAPGPVGESLRNAGAAEARLAADDVSLELVVGIASRYDVPRVEITETDTAVFYRCAAPDQDLAPRSKVS